MTLHTAQTLASLTSPEFEALLEDAKRAYLARHEMLLALGIAETDHLEIDRSRGIVRFVANSGVSIEARAQTLGSYEGGSGTWEWAWNHPDVPAAWKHDARTVELYGQEHKLAPLTTGIIRCTFSDAWQLVVVAVHIVNAEAAYGGPIDATVIAFALRDVQAINPRRTTT